MKLIKWKIKDKVYEFPETWSKREVIDFVNDKTIHKCSYCGKLDISRNHFSKCKSIKSNNYERNISVGNAKNPKKKKKIRTKR